MDVRRRGVTGQHLWVRSSQIVVSFPRYKTAASSNPLLLIDPSHEYTLYSVKQIRAGLSPLVKISGQVGSGWAVQKRMLSQINSGQNGLQVIVTPLLSCNGSVMAKALRWRTTTLGSIQSSCNEEHDYDKWETIVVHALARTVESLRPGTRTLSGYERHIHIYQWKSILFRLNMHSSQSRTEMT